MPSFSTETLAKKLNAKHIGDSCNIASLRSYLNADSGAAVFAEDEKFLIDAVNSDAGVVLVSSNLLDNPICAELFDKSGKTKLVVKYNVRLAWAKLLSLFKVPIAPFGLHSGAFISDTATIGENVSIGAGCVISDGAIIGSGTIISANCYIGNLAVVGEDSVLHSGVNVYDNVRIGNKCIIHSGVVIGSDGLGFIPTADGWVKLEHIASVLIGDRVEMGANTCIDRGQVTDTIIGDGTKIDNMVHIAHNVQIGKNCLICSQSVFAGSSEIGNNCVIGGNCAISDHIKIVDGVTVAGMSSVGQSIEKAGTYASHIQVHPYSNWKRIEVALKYMPDIFKTYKKLLQNGVDKKLE